MDKDLESKIEERKKQAEKRHIWTKACTVAKYLGERDYYDSKTGLTETNYAFSNDDFLVIDKYSESSGSDGTMGGSSTRVDYKNKTVFHYAGAGILSYIPGTWEKKLTMLYGKAEGVRKQKEQEEQEKNKKLVKKEEYEEKAKWGL